MEKKVVTNVTQKTQISTKKNCKFFFFFFKVGIVKGVVRMLQQIRMAIAMQHETRLLNKNYARLAIKVHIFIF